MHIDLKNHYYQSILFIVKININNPPSSIKTEIGSKDAQTGPKEISEEK